MMSLEEQIRGMVDKFNKKSEGDEKLRKELAHLSKTFTIDLGTESYGMKLHDSRISDFRAEAIPDSDITVISTPESLQAMIDGELRPMKAYITKKIKIKGNLQDLMFLKKFL
jgi:putative sterol carrier protein